MLKRKNSVVGRGGKCYEKSGKLVEICTNFEELGGIWEYHQILFPKIVGLGIFGNWVANIRKMEIGGWDYN